MAVAEFQVCDRDLPEDLMHEFLKAEAIAIDTETMGLLPQRDRLCLVQLCDPNGTLAVVRIERGQTTTPHLQRLFEAPAVTKVFHFARFDIATLNHHLGIVTTPLFCTKIASKLIRTYSPRHGLKELVMELEQVELDKSAQSSDWGNAANDVRYLLPIRQKLIAMLEREERLELAYECFTCLPTIVSLDLLQYPNVFEH
jgi:ribonuclease D